MTKRGHTLMASIIDITKQGAVGAVDSNPSMAQYFTQQEIQEYRQCFALYCPKGYAQNASHLRYIMRSLGYTPTIPETIQYFRKYGQKLDFPCFLEILNQENHKNDPVEEITGAFRGIDSKNQGVDEIKTEKFHNGNKQI
ncbi:Calmodulin-like protein [Dirofilaria immitis]